MFPDTSKVSQMVFSMLFRPVWFIWSYPQNYLSIRVSLGDYSRLQSFRPLLRLIQNQERITRSLVEAVSYPDRSGRKFEGME